MRSHVPGRSVKLILPYHRNLGTAAMPMVAALCRARGLFLAGDGADKPEWRHKVFACRPLPIAYRLSSFGYSVIGVMLILYEDAMRRCDKGFWWCAVGAALCVQGPVSYMGDVVCWGRQDRAARTWKALDPVLASTLTVVVGPIICYRMAQGVFSLPASIARTWTTGVVLAVTAKAMGARRAHQGCSCEEMLVMPSGMEPRSATT